MSQAISYEDTCGDTCGETLEAQQRLGRPSKWCLRSSQHPGAPFPPTPHTHCHPHVHMHRPRMHHLLVRRRCAIAQLATLCGVSLPPPARAAGRRSGHRCPAVCTRGAAKTAPAARHPRLPAGRQEPGSQGIGRVTNMQVRGRSWRLHACTKRTPMHAHGAPQSAGLCCIVRQA